MNCGRPAGPCPAGQRINIMTSGQARLPVAPSLFKFAHYGACRRCVSKLLSHTAWHVRRRGQVSNGSISLRPLYAVTAQAVMTTSHGVRAGLHAGPAGAVGCRPVSTASAPVHRHRPGYDDDEPHGSYP